MKDRSVYLVCNFICEKSTKFAEEGLSPFHYSKDQNIKLLFVVCEYDSDQSKINKKFTNGVGGQHMREFFTNKTTSHIY